MTDERGFTLVELIVSIAIGMMVVLGVFALVDVSMRNSARIAARVDADQRARPVLQRLVDELHSACLGPDSSPVLVGSGDSTIGFLHRTGAAVSPTPDKRVVTLTGGTLSESVYPVTGGTAPNWTFATSPSSTRQLLTGVGSATAGDPPVERAAVPVLRRRGRAARDAAADPARRHERRRDGPRHGLVLGLAAQHTRVDDENAAVSVSDSVYLRFSPFSEDPTKVNGPCA